MPGPNSAFDRNDHQLLERLTREVGRLADAVEELNEDGGGR